MSVTLSFFFLNKLMASTDTKVEYLFSLQYYLYGLVLCLISLRAARPCFLCGNFARQSPTFSAHSCCSFLAFIDLALPRTPIFKPTRIRHARKKTGISTGATMIDDVAEVIVVVDSEDEATVLSTAKVVGIPSRRAVRSQHSKAHVLLNSPNLLFT